MVLCIGFCVALLSDPFPLLPWLSIFTKYKSVDLTLHQLHVWDMFVQCIAQSSSTYHWIPNTYTHGCDPIRMFILEKGIAPLCSTPVWNVPCSEMLPDAVQAWLESQHIEGVQNDLVEVRNIFKVLEVCQAAKLEDWQATVKHALNFFKASLQLLRCTLHMLCFLSC